jgi:hypothetical protein
VDRPQPGRKPSGCFCAHFPPVGFQVSFAARKPMTAEMVGSGTTAFGRPDGLSGSWFSQITLVENRMIGIVSKISVV